MARDLNLVRLILIKASHADDTLARIRPIQIEGYEDFVVARHVHMMHEADLIVANVGDSEAYGIGTTPAYVVRVTWKGYDFLDATSDPTVWQKTWEQIRKSGGSFTFAIVKAVATAELKRRLGLEL